MTACARGCTLPLSHLQGCSCASDGHQHNDHCDQCAGCTPSPTYLGQLCKPDVNRLRRTLEDAAGVTEWIRDQVQPGSPSGAPRVDGTREPPAPLSLTALDDADAILATLWDCATHVMDAHQLVGPSHVGLRVLPQVKTRTADGDTVYPEARVAGLRPDADPVEVVGNVAGWLLAQLAEVAGLPNAGDIHDDITDTLRTVANRWPQQDRQRKLPLPCPACDLALLYLHPPAGPPARDENGDIRWAHQHLVCCHNDACNEVMTHDSYYLAATTALAERGTPKEAA